MRLVGWVPVVLAVVVGGCAGGSGTAPYFGEEVAAGVHGVSAARCGVRAGRVSCTEELRFEGAGLPPIRSVLVDQTASTACAVDYTGALYCWGTNVWGVAGQGWVPEEGVRWSEAAARVPEPKRVARVPPIRTLAAGQFFFCALAVDHSVWCWGRNERSQITSNSTYGAISLPVRVEGIPPADELVAAVDQVCVRTGEDVICWGDAPEGQPRTPRVVTRGATGLFIGGERSDEICAARADGNECWSAAPTLASLREER